MILLLGLFLISGGSLYAGGQLRSHGQGRVLVLAKDQDRVGDDAALKTGTIAQDDADLSER
jgi:hypothetical protein